MLFGPPDKKTLHQALLDKSSKFENQVYVCSQTTGFFCRFTCSTPRDKNETYLFFENIAQCLEAGFKPCTHCRPILNLKTNNTNVDQLLKAIDNEPERRWSENDIIKLGLDPIAVRKSFKRYFGTTFLNITRQLKRHNKTENFEEPKTLHLSKKEFQQSILKLLGRTSNDLDHNALLKIELLQSPIGPLVTICDRESLHLLEFFDRRALGTELKNIQKLAKQSIGFGRFQTTDQIEEELRNYFCGKNLKFSTPLSLAGTPFYRTVWRQLMKIEAGQTQSYLDLAIAIEKPTAVRAVARANGANQIGIIIPCHRVIGSNGTMTGYGGGIWRKQWLLEHENRSCP